MEALRLLDLVDVGEDWLRSSSMALAADSVVSWECLTTGRQGSSQSDPCTITGFGSFKLPTCDWLQKGQSHSRMESSLVWWLREMLHVGLM